MNEPPLTTPASSKPSPPPRPPPPPSSFLTKIKTTTTSHTTNNDPSSSSPSSNLINSSTTPPLPPRPSLPHQSQSLNVNFNQLNLSTTTSTPSSFSSFFTPTPGRRSMVTTPQQSSTSSFFNSTTRRIGSLGKGGIVPSFLRNLVSNQQTSSSNSSANSNNSTTTMAGSSPAPPNTGHDGRPRGITESGLRVRASVDNGNVVTPLQVTRPGLQLGIQLGGDNSSINNHTNHQRPSQLVSAACLSPRPRPRPFPGGLGLMEIPKPAVNPISPKDLSDRFGANNLLHIDGKEYPITQEELVEMEELGTGASGQVFKRKHVATGKMLAVKQMRISKDEQGIKRIAMDLETLLKCSSSEHIVKCYGYIIRDTEVWICMGLMESCFEKLLKKLKRPFPEDIIGKVAVATLKALNYLKENHKVMHRDVKPSNILVNEDGLIKLCDFGISGNLVDSRARTRGAGCTAYLAPERIASDQPHYDVRADVWSFGITLVELAKGEFPYPGCECDFQVLTMIVKQDAPSLQPEKDGFSQEFCDFTRQCLIKDFHQRPKYKKLLEHPFIKKYEEKDVDVASWLRNVLLE